MRKSFTFTKGTVHQTLLPTIKKPAFTLAEVLITLSIIGVVAAMTIPNLLNNIKANQLRSQFLKSYSVIQQAFRQMKADEVPIDLATYRQTGSFYKEFGKYVKAALDCGRFGYAQKNNSLCFYKTQTFNEETTTTGYKTFDGEKIFSDVFIDDGQLVLLDGSTIFFENSSYSNVIYISVDLNGYKTPPNRAGYDLFTFEIKDEEVLPMGSPGTKYTQEEVYCNKSKKNKYNGIACAAKAKNDPNYFKKILKEK
ncbi:MAG: type II secretion system GspH family protein [Muribaculaceae bacterium]|nr:type II secretion system GspH family protein [Muribaculaceae bacterium]